MKTYTMQICSIKDSDGWGDLIFSLKFDSFCKSGLDKDSDETFDLFYDSVVRKYFKFGEYGDIEIEVNENMEIVGGKIFPQR